MFTQRVPTIDLSTVLGELQLTHDSLMVIHSEAIQGCLSCWQTG